MTQAIGLLPSGHIHCYTLSAGQKEKPLNDRIAKAFSRHASEGLFELAVKGKEHELSATSRYWHHFSSLYLKKRCLETFGDLNPLPSIDALDKPQANKLLSIAPPMQGAEYLSVDALQNIWDKLDAWLQKQVENVGSFGAFLAKKAPQWHQVGRVCFHLAENPRDPDYPFAFMATYSQEISSQGKPRYHPLSHALQEYAGTKNTQAMIRLLTPVSRAADSSPLIKELVGSGDLYHPLAWTTDEAYRFLKETPKYESSGILLRLPDWWKQRTRPQISITLGDKKQKRVDIDSLLDFKLNIALGDQSLSQRELQQLLKMENGLVYFKGQWIEVDQNKLQEALTHWESVAAEATENGLSFIEGMRLLAGAPVDLGNSAGTENAQAWSFVKPGKWLGTLLDQLRSPEAIRKSTPGKALKATLRPYQKQGVNWLWLLSQLGLGACLADDMGLGKTVQIIALLLLVKKSRTRNNDQCASLIILPASLLSNWKAELERFAPSLRCVFVHSAEMSKRTITEWAENPGSRLSNKDVVLTTYSMLTRQQWLHDQQWQLVVLDEAQAIKNPTTRQAKTVKTLRAKARIALTGTPVENRLSDLWSLFDFLNPGLLGSAKRFKAFAKSLADDDSHQYAPLRNLVRPYILRRLKTDHTIISDLPDKTEIIAYCSLSKRQAVLYQKSVKEFEHSLQNLEGIKRRGLVFAYLMRFKQICNHSTQLTGDGDYDLKGSGKFLRLTELCEEIALRQQKVLIFTQFREITDPLAACLEQVFGQPGLILHGGTPVKQRQKLVDQFQNEEGPPFFILSIKAGGTGLNLTQASHVIHFDRWWNPAVENQATDRAFRIGQKNNVLVHKFVCRGTVEEKINAMIEEKKALANDILEGGAETLLTEMKNDEIIQLVSLDIDKTKAN
jgi:non-specific serine/threonine protein kinase